MNLSKSCLIIDSPAVAAVCLISSLFVESIKKGNHVILASFRGVGLYESLCRKQVSSVYSK